MSVNHKGEEHTYLKPMPAHRFVERHLIFLMIEELNEAGWRLVRFDPCEAKEDITLFPRQYPPGPNGLMHLKEKAWEAYDQWDEGYFFFKEENDEGRENWVRVIGGNGEDCISDYGDIKRFGAILEKVFLY